jgi:hypothetical protein
MGGAIAKKAINTTVPNIGQNSFFIKEPPLFISLKEAALDVSRAFEAIDSLTRGIDKIMLGSRRAASRVFGRA